LSIKVNIFYDRLRQAMHNPETITADGQTIGECLDDLVRRYPDITSLIFNKQRQLLDHVYVYVNAESLLKPELSRPVRAGDTLIIAVLLTGG
jgi:hypothetical protein